jgi:hypothetical protein
MKVKKIFLAILGFFATAFSREEFERFSQDNRGGLVLSFGYELPDSYWLEYRLLRQDNSVKSVSPKDLPDDFCEEACRLVDEFHRKTVNQKIEWMLYFDYTAGEVVYCWKGEEGKIKCNFDRIHLSGRTITSVHNHQKGYYSFPSGENFDILENDFEDYEIITSINSLWVIEFKGKVGSDLRKEFQYSIGCEIDGILLGALLMGQTAKEIDEFREKMISNYLLTSIDKKVNNIDLELNKKELI